MQKVIVCLFFFVLIFISTNSLSDTFAPDAEILLNERIATIHLDGTMETVTHRIIKVNTYEGIERYKKLDITYNKDYDEVIITKVQKLNQPSEISENPSNLRNLRSIDSKMPKQIPDSIYPQLNPVNPVKNSQQSNFAPFAPLREKSLIPPSANLYLNTKTITMPIEKPGDIFEYEIIVRRFKSLIKNHFWNVHIFNDVMPIKKSIFTVSIPNVGAGLAPALYYKTYNMQLEPSVENTVAVRFIAQNHKGTDDFSNNQQLTTNNQTNRPTNQQTNQTKTYTWQLENIPAISITQGLNPTPDMLSRIVISSTNTWDDIANWFNTIYEDKIIPDKKIQKKVQSLIEGTEAQRHKGTKDFSNSQQSTTNNQTNRPTDQSDQQTNPTNPVNPVNNNLPISNPSSSHFQSLIRPLFDYVAYSMPFLGNELGKGAFIPRPATDVLSAHQGDCKDKVVLLTTMLRAAGIEAYPALLNSVSEISIEEQLPTPYYFNHAIVYVPKQKDLTSDLWLDPTISSGRWNFIPLEDRGKTALILNGENSKFIKIVQ